MSSDAKKAGNARHQAQLDRIVIQPENEEGTIIRQAAANAGQSVQGYILQAIKERMGRENTV